MSVFSDAELAFPQGGEAGLDRLATVGSNGMPHVTSVGWAVVPEAGVFEIGGRNFAATKKYRDVVHTGVAAIVIDVRPPWRPRGVEVRERAEAISGPQPKIRIHADPIISWGLDS